MTPDTGDTVGSSSITQRRAAGPRRRGVREAGAARRSPRRSLGVPVASLTVKDGRRLGRRQDRHLRRADRRQALQRARSPRATLNPGQSPAKPVEPVHARRHEPAADRHPGQGHRHATPTSTTSGCRGCCTAASSGRAARARYGTGAQIALGRRELDQAHRRASRSSAQGRLPRRRRAEGVRRDPGGGAAQGEVGRDARCCRAAATCAARCARRTRPGRRRDRRRQRATSTPRSRSAAKVADARATRSTTRRTARSARRAAVADVTPDGARRAHEHAGRLPPARQRSPSLLGLPRDEDPRAVLRGLERLRPLRPRTTRPQAAALMSQLAGGKPVRLQFMRWDDHGWDNYGPAPARRHPRRRSTRTGRSSRSTTRAGVQPLRTRTARARRRTSRLGFGADQRRAPAARTRASSTATHYAIANRRVIEQVDPARRAAAASRRRRSGRRATPQASFAFEQMIDELALRGEHGPGRVPARADDATTAWLVGPERRRRRRRTGSRASRRRSSSNAERRHRPRRRARAALGLAVGASSPTSR